VTSSRESDRRLIHDLILGYCRGVDRLDFELVRSAYHPGGIDHHTGFDGTVEEYIPWLQSVLPRLDGTMHVVANHLVEFDGPRAVSETYGFAVHWGSPPDNPAVNFTSGFRYIDSLEYRADRWGITERHAVREWTRSDAGSRVAREAPGPAGSRDGGDPLYAHLARLRRSAGPSHS
jgi:hypothetical protein